MNIVDADTGEEFILYPTDERNEDLDAFARSACAHPQTEIRRCTVAGGAIHVRRQCMTCGELIGSAIKKDNVPADTLPKDEKLPETYQAARNAEYQSIVQRHIRKQKAKDTSWWARYNEHLKSPEWAARREKVLERANGVCEGCGEKTAAQVHHLSYKSYENLGREFLFELAAVCKDCHEHLHPEQLDSEWYEGHPCEACRWQSEQDDRRWCAKFDIAAKEALAADGPCGPAHAALEGLK